MSRPLTLSIGGKVPDPHAPMEQTSPAPAPGNEIPAAPGNAIPVAPAAAAPASNESLAAVYEILKRHEETLRDLIIEVRLLYYHLPEKDRKRLETQRDAITRQMRDSFAGQIHALDETIAKLRSGQ